MMSALIGVPFPLNSVGVLPSELLNVSGVELVHMIVANAAQIAALSLRNHCLLVAAQCSFVDQTY